jgi:Delta3-Delta2-enoyl-CoA isomerase
VTHAFYTHPKILVTALNGPAVGLSAALIAFSDFIYCSPHAYLLTPFTSLGLVAEGGASRAFVQRLGVAKANEALIMSKRITAEELAQTGFVNKVIAAGTQPGASGGKGFDSDAFLAEVLGEIEERMGEHLNQESMVKVKGLIRQSETEMLDRQGVLEVLGGLERFARGIPQREFAAIASGQKKHKL